MNNSKYAATKIELQILISASYEYHKLPARSKGRRELLSSTCDRLQKNAPKGNWNIKRTRQWFFNNNPNDAKKEDDDIKEELKHIQERLTLYIPPRLNYLVILQQLYPKLLQMCS